MGGAIACCAILIIFICLKTVSVLWMAKDNGEFDSKKSDILERRNYLVEIVKSPEIR